MTAGIDFALASHISAMWVLSNGYVLTQGQLLAVYASEPLRLSHVLPSVQACALAWCEPCGEKSDAQRPDNGVAGRAFGWAHLLSVQA